MKPTSCPKHPDQPYDDCSICERLIAAEEDRAADGPEFTDELPGGGRVHHCGFDMNYPAWGEW